MEGGNEANNSLEKEAKESLEKIKISNTQNPKGNNETKNNDFPTGWIIGGGILAVIGLATFLVIRNKKKRRV